MISYLIFLKMWKYIDFIKYLYRKMYSNFLHGLFVSYFDGISTNCSDSSWLEVWFRWLNSRLGRLKLLVVKGFGWDFRSLIVWKICSTKKNYELNRSNSITKIFSIHFMYSDVTSARTYYECFPILNEPILENIIIKSHQYI